MQYGRRTLFTDVEEITSENIIKVLRQAVLEHSSNADDCTELLNFEKGVQPITRTKTFRPDINAQVSDNVANEITEFKTSFNWNPIMLVQRGEIDSGSEIETEAISLLNECYASEEISEKTRELARFVEICGIGYTVVDINTEYEDGDSYFKVNVLDPRYAFVVRSSRHADHRIMLGVSFRKDINGNRYFTCFTKYERFEIINLKKIKNKQTAKWAHGERSGEINPLGRVPITEWIRDFDRMGCFERQIPALNNLNLILSDFTNDIEQNCMCLWRTNDVEFPTEKARDKDGNEIEVVRKPKDGEWMQTFTTQDGKTPIVEPLVVDYNYEGMLAHYLAQRSLILQRCNVPVRNAEMSNSTGIAQSFAGGYASAESQADKQADIRYGCQKEELKSVLAAIRECPATPVDSPLLKLKYTDIQPKTIRQRSYEMSVKSSTLKNLISSGVNGLHAFEVVGLFSDVVQAWVDSKDMVESYQKSLFSKESQQEEEPQTTDGGMEAQVSNSPLIDGPRVLQSQNK